MIQLYYSGQVVLLNLVEVHLGPTPSPCLFDEVSSCADSGSLLVLDGALIFNLRPSLLHLDLGVCWASPFFNHGLDHEGRVQTFIVSCWIILVTSDEGTCLPYRPGVIKFTETIDAQRYLPFLEFLVGRGVNLLCHVLDI